jgi:hypothetical protein
MVNGAMNRNVIAYFIGIFISVCFPASGGELIEPHPLPKDYTHKRVTEIPPGKSILGREGKIPAEETGENITVYVDQETPSNVHPLEDTNTGGRLETLLPEGRLDTGVPLAPLRPSALGSFKVLHQFSHALEVTLDLKSGQLLRALEDEIAYRVGYDWFHPTNHTVGAVDAGLGFDGWLFPGEPRHGTVDALLFPDP